MIMFENRYALIKGIDKDSYDFETLKTAIQEIFLENGKFNKLYCMNPRKDVADNLDASSPEYLLANEHVYTDRAARSNDEINGTSLNACFNVKTAPITEKLRDVVKKLVLEHSERLTGTRKHDIEIDAAWVIIVDTGGYVSTHTHVADYSQLNNSGTIALSLHDSGHRLVTFVDDPAPFKQEHEFSDDKKVNIFCEPGDFLIMKGDTNHCVPISDSDCHPLIVFDFRYT